MSQGFQLQINNGTTITLFFSVMMEQNFEETSSIPASIKSGSNSGQLYFQVADGDVGILQIGFGIDSVDIDGNLYLHFDSHNTNEFNGLIYIAGFARSLVSDMPNTYIYPYLILNQVNGYPFGNMTFVTVSDPTLSEYPNPPQ